ncbi:MAG: DUF4292 domain-containing protein [Candidatus Sulfotelmatobacter sp.]
MRRAPLLQALSLLLAVLPAIGCGVFSRTRPVEETYSKAPLLTATQQELVDSINQQAEKIHSLQATVDIDTSAGGIKKGEVTDYKEIRGYVLARKPAMLHMQGLLPIVRTVAFDMVSNGQDFKLWIPPKNRFVMGRNEVQTTNSAQPLENIRPQNIYDALLIHRIAPPERALVENSYEILHDAKGHPILQEDYVLLVIRMEDDSDPVLSRKIVFSRTDLKPHQQLIFDDKGNVSTDARYANYKDYDGVNFPSRIEIKRPQEEYDITLNMLKLEINKPLKDEQFTLEQPAGADVVHLDGPQSSSTRAPSADRER